MRHIWLAVGLASLITACGSSASPSPSAAEPLPSAAVRTGLPPGCAPIDLRAPSGEAVDLTGQWAGSGKLTADDEVASLIQIGDCIFGTVSGTNAFGLPGVYQVLTTLRGRVDADFTIPFEVVVVRQHPFLRFAEYSPVPFFVEWGQDGRLRLREDREPGITAPRCVPLSVPCPDPVLWYRVDEAPPP